jgi:hypothetical protein
MKKKIKTEKEVIQVRNIYFASYLISKGISPIQVEFKENYTIWVFPYLDEIYNLQTEFYTNTQLQLFIGAIKQLKKQIINRRLKNEKNNQ